MVNSSELRGVVVVSKAKMPDQRGVSCQNQRAAQTKFQCPQDARGKT